MEFIESHFGGAAILAWVDGVTFEQSAREQVQRMSAMPFVVHQAVMPDVHAGIGSTVGTVIATKGAIIPAAVGVDIGCGMSAIRTSLTSKDLPENTDKLRDDIERAVPHGGKAAGGWMPQKGGVPLSVVNRWHNSGLEARYKLLEDRYKFLGDAHALTQLGSLGGGNHFIEMCLDEEDRVWIMLHSGSRGTGNIIGRNFIAKAREMLIHRHGAHHVPDKDLAWFEEGEAEFDEYITAMRWAQDYARQNRDAMLERVMRVVRDNFKPFTTDKSAINCHHNFTEEETHPINTGGEADGDVWTPTKIWVTRKGAVRASEDTLGIIPGSMGAKSYIVSGKGNALSLCSCSHGAGRVMSRTKAKESFTVEDVLAQTQGVNCRKDADIIDEIPGAYKDIDAVMAAQTDLVKVEHTLKQFLCVKG